MDSGQQYTTSNQPNFKFNKWLILGLSLAVIIVIIAIVTAIFSSQPQNHNNTPTEETSNALKNTQNSFNALVGTMMYGEKSDSQKLDYTIDINNWAVVKTAKNGSSESKSAFAETLTKLQKDFRDNVSHYLLQPNDKNLSNIRSSGTAIDAKITSIILYLQAEKNALELPSMFSDNPDDINTKVSNLLSSAYGSQIKEASSMATNLSAYYQGTVEQIRTLKEANCPINESINSECASNLRKNNSGLDIIAKLTGAFLISATNEFNNTLSTLSDLLYYYGAYLSV